VEGMTKSCIYQICGRHVFGHMLMYSSRENHMTKPKDKTVTTITISDKLHQQVKLRAVRDKISASSIYEKAAEEYLKQKK
jgi:hypothetical protein